MPSHWPHDERPALRGSVPHTVGTVRAFLFSNFLIWNMEITLVSPYCISITHPLLDALLAPGPNGGWATRHKNKGVRLHSGEVSGAWFVLHAVVERGTPSCLYNYCRCGAVVYFGVTLRARRQLLERDDEPGPRSSRCLDLAFLMGRDVAAETAAPCWFE